MTDISKVATLINKLLALSKDDGATEAEASLAAEKAQALMTEHNLSMAAIEAQGGASGDEGQRTKDGIEHRQVYKWQRTLMSELAELNFCFCQERFEGRGGVYGSRTSVFAGYTLIGRAANVASTIIMFKYLLQTINRLAKEEVEDPKDYFTRYAHSFKEGCSDRIIERLQQRRQQEVMEAERRKKDEQARASHPSYASSNALVVVLGDYVQDEKDLNEDFKRGWPPGTTKKNRAEWEREVQEHRAEQAAAKQARRNELLAQRPELSNDEFRLDYLASGFSDEWVDRLLAPSKPETDAQRRKREEREYRERRRQDERYWRQQSRLDGRGYNKGYDKGADVGLDQQIDGNSTPKLTRGT